MARTTETYWSVSEHDFDTWASALGYAAAGKLMAACAAYMLHGTMPEECGIKLNRAARGMFDAERPRLDKRRACAESGAQGGRRKAEGAEKTSVENPTDAGKSSQHCPKNSEKLEKSSEKLPKNSEKLGTDTPADLRNQQNSLAPNMNMNMNINPQTPAAPTDGARGSGAVSAAELAALLDAGLGFDAPTAYGAAQRRTGWRAVS